MFDRNQIAIIDVRTPNELAFEHIPGAMLFSMSSFDPAELPDQGDKRLVFHCGFGMRSHKVAERCAAAGVRQIAHIEGGFGAWKTAGLPYLAVDRQLGRWCESLEWARPRRCGLSIDIHQGVG
jgi:rhodanese-related sulfurtransferase